MTDPTSNPAEDVFRLMYRSRSRIASEERPTELGSLFATARSNNKKRDITGALLVSEDRFVQVLEGDAGGVQSLYRTIERDSRHHEVELMDSGPVTGRAFEHWSMAKVATEGDADIPLIATIGEAAPVTAWSTTAEQDRILDEMRQAAETT